MIWSVQVVFDAGDPDEVILFWGPVLGYDSEVPLTREELRAFRRAYPQFDGRGRIDDRAGRRMPVYIQAVPEPKTTPNRVRLEIGVPSDGHHRFVTRLLEMGAHRAPDGFRDPEGNEFTVVADDAHDTPFLRTITLDAVDPAGLLGFWSEALGYVAHGDRCDPPAASARVRDGWIVVGGERIGPVGPVSGARSRAILDLIPGVAFRRVAEPKASKNRIHLDLNSTDIDADRRRLEGLGARVLHWETDFVMCDPEDNEFCLSTARGLVGLRG